jgi:hypothetical protein
MPYGSCLELDSEASKEAARKRKNDADAGPTGKRAKVSSRKATTPKALATTKGIGAAS